MPKTVITAPHKPTAQRAPIAQAEAAPVQPPGEATALQPEQEAPPQSLADRRAADLAEYQKIEQNLADGLASVASQRAKHEAALVRIAQRLPAIPAEIEAAHVPVARLRAEQEALPRQIGASRALVMASAGTNAEAGAEAQLATFQARAKSLPPELEQAEATEQETREALVQEQTRLEEERGTHQAALRDLATMAQHLEDAARQASRQVAEAALLVLSDQAREVVEAREKAQREVDTQAEALRKLTQETKEQLTRTPDLLLLFQNEFVEIDDPTTQRLRQAIIYRRALMGWAVEGDAWHGNLPIKWLVPQSVEWSSARDRMDEVIREMEAALQQHITSERTRVR